MSTAQKQDILELCMAGWGCCDCDGNKACFREAGMEISRLRYEVTRLALTAAEYAAIERSIQRNLEVAESAESAGLVAVEAGYREDAVTLRAMLTRFK